MPASSDPRLSLSTRALVILTSLEVGLAVWTGGTQRWLDVSTEALLFSGLLLVLVGLRKLATSARADLVFTALVSATFAASMAGLALLTTGRDGALAWTVTAGVIGLLLPLALGLRGARDGVVLTAVASSFWLAAGGTWLVRAGTLPWGAWTALAIGGAGLAALVRRPRWLALPPGILVAAAIVPFDGFQPPPDWTASGEAPTGPDIVMIVVDTLRADSAATMSTHARLAREGVDLGPAQAAAPWTLASMTSIFTAFDADEHGAGRMPNRNGERVVQGVDPAQPTLTQVLARAGYDTAAVLDRNPYLASRRGLSAGFAHFDFAHRSAGRFVLPAISDFQARPLGVQALLSACNEFGLPTLRRWLAFAPRGGAPDVVDRGLRVLEERRPDRPLFLWLHLMDPHVPYRHAGDLTELPRSMTSRLERLGMRRVRASDTWSQPEGEAILRQAYANEVEVVDQALERLLDTLGPEPEQGRIVVLTADHGEEFFEHGDFEHGHSLHQEVIAVPLVLGGDSVAALPELQRPVGTVQLAPLLLELAGVPRPSDFGTAPAPAPASSTSEPPPLVSSNLLYPSRGSSPTEDYAVREGDWKLISHGGAQLYDLSEDPRERHDLAGQEPDRVEALEESQPGTPPQRDAVQPTSAEVEELRVLGYLE